MARRRLACRIPPSHAAHLHVARSRSPGRWRTAPGWLGRTRTAAAGHPERTTRRLRDTGRRLPEAARAPTLGRRHDPAQSTPHRPAPHMQTPADQPQQRSIGHPCLKQLQQLGTIHAVEEGLNVSFQNPAHFAPVRHSVQSSTSVMGRSLESKAKAPIQEALFADRLQYPAHSILDDIALKRRNPDRPRLALRLWDMPTPNRLVSISLRLQPLVQVLEPGLQILPDRLLRDAISDRRGYGRQETPGAELLHETAKLRPGRTHHCQSPAHRHQLPPPRRFRYPKPLVDPQETRAAMPNSRRWMPRPVVGIA